MDRSIRYSRTADGMDVAHWSHGDGHPLVAMPSLPWSHIQLEWKIPSMRSWYEAMGRGRRLVRYDGRGFGLGVAYVPNLGIQAADTVKIFTTDFETADIATSRRLSLWNAPLGRVRFELYQLQRRLLDKILHDILIA